MLNGNELKWNFRRIDTRHIKVKNINKDNREIEVFDTSMNLPFFVEIPEELSLESVTIDNKYLVRVKVYTIKLTHNTVVPELTEFFQVIDIQRRFDEFIKAAFIDHRFFKFELIDIEPL